MGSIWHAPRSRQRMAPPSERRKFHLKIGPGRATWGQLIWQAMSNKEHRSTILWWGSAFGALMLGGYYLWLGFTPAISFSQGSLLLLQSCLVGVFLTGYLAVALLFPAWAYNALDIKLDSLPQTSQRKAATALSRRSIASQSCAISGFFILFLTLHSDLKDLDAVLFSGSLLVFGFSLIVLMRMPVLAAFQGKENKWGFLSSVVVLGFSGLMSAVVLYIIYDTPATKDRASGWFFLLALVVIVFTSAAMSPLKKESRWSQVLMGLFALVTVLAVFNSVSMPFRGVAGALGIAVFQPVEVALPPATCELVRKSLADKTKLRCDGDDGGLLEGIQVLNTVGERWVIREREQTENIIFEGKGAVIHRLPPAPQT